MFSNEFKNVVTLSLHI